MNNRFLRLVMVAFMAMVMAISAGWGLSGPVQADGEPPAGTVQSVQTYTLYPATVITTNATYVSEGMRLEGWNAADVFVVADVGSGAAVTATVQVSPDNTNWATLDYEYADADALNTQSYQRVMSADGTELMRVPMAGEYLRVSLTTSGNVTPTVLATMRNN